jgi:citrate lyase beta subunit
MNLRRSLLYMPGTDWRKIEKAATELDADSVCLDLEDGVALNAKAEARETVIRALQTLDFRCSEKLVRINAMDSGLAEEDLATTLPAHPDGIVVPKVRSGQHVQWLHEQLSSAEQRYGWKGGSLCMILIIESAQGIVELDEIIKASPRIAALVFGAEDFASDIGAVRTKESFEVLYARSKVVTYAKARGMQAIDIVYADFRDPEGFTAEAKQGMGMGYTGKQLIHPNQIPLIHAVSMPTEAEIAHARRVVDAHEAHQKSGTGAFALDGKMVDMPVVKQAELVLERAGTDR